MNRCPAYILAGGKSRRFGSDKALALLDGKTLIERSAGTLEKWACSVTLIAQRENQYAAFGLRTITDVNPGLGPLGGLLTALRDAKEHAWILLVSCDLTMLESHWLDSLWQLAQVKTTPRTAIVFQGSPPHPWQPFPGLYHRDLLAAVQQKMDAGELAMRRLLEQANCTLLPLPADWPAIPQVNTPDDLQRHQHREE